MQEPIAIQGRILTSEDLAAIEDLIRRHPQWHRTRLSQELCRMWEWRTPAGELKDMACRTMLLKLHRSGLLQLPPTRRPGTNHRRGKSFQPVLHDTIPRQCSFSELGPVRLVLADKGPHRDLWQTLLHGYPPWVRVPHLASHLLSLAARRISGDWQLKYGHELVLLETFVEQGRFEGTCYKAANWRCVGQTTGRTRNDSAHTLQTPIKSIFVYPLHRTFRRALTRE